MRGILLDIEGTTTPISFVYEVLFPFARGRLRDYLKANVETPDVQADVARLREEHAEDVARNLSPPALIDEAGEAELDSLAAYVHWLMDRDRKSTGLKSLQGKIWELGYRNGALKSQVFPDVPPALERWRHAGLKVSIFSSGSALAQRLLFAYTNAGDLSRFIDSYFDTTTGAKNVPESYRRIASALGLTPAEILFISDIVAELDACGSAGMQEVLCVRPANHPQPATDEIRISSFDEIVE
jgi:enolase-phosphatase E1